MANKWVENRMGVEEGSHRLCDILVRRIVRNTDRNALKAAFEEKSRYARMDAIGDIIRASALRCHMCMINGTPHIYDSDNGVYAPFSWIMLENAIYVSMRKLKVKDGDYSRVEQYCKIIRRAISARTVEPDASVVVMSNGVYDTSDFTFHDFSPEYVSITKVSYPYDIDAECTRWSCFLNEVLPDVGMQRLLQQFIAACYVDRRKVKLEKMMFLKGSGSNGKSVVFEVMLALLGPDNVSTFAISELTGSMKERNLASCNGMRLNYCSEMRTSELNASNSDSFKSLVSGEPMMARALYQDPFKATCIPLMMANCNQMPVMKDPSLSLLRRILILPFDETIEEPRQDKTLADSLKSELPGIFNWAMQGLSMFSACGYDFDIPKKVTELVDRYVNDSTPVLRWLEEVRYHNTSRAVTHDRDSWMLATRLYGEFHTWSRNAGEEYIGRSDFLRILDANGFISRRAAEGIVYHIHQGMSEEEFQSMNMQLAERLIKEKHVQEVEEKLKEAVKKSSDGRVFVYGVNQAEKYLGLPLDTIWYYIQAGRLGICAKHTAGGWMFDVAELQRVLAYEGYYTELSYGEETLKSKAKKSLLKLRNAFNADMKRLGLPFRQYDRGFKRNMEGFIWVPDGWNYTKANAVLAWRNADRSGALKNLLN